MRRQRNVHPAAFGNLARRMHINQPDWQARTFSDIAAVRYGAVMREKASRMPFQIRRLSALDAAPYRDLRLAGLRAHPEAFGASWEEESVRPLTWFADRVDRNVIFGGGPADTSDVQGIVGFYVVDGAKQRHKGVLWGLYVEPAARGAGLGLSLIARVLEHAARTVEEIRLTVVTTNMAAIRLYERVGFEQYGLERRALKIGDDDYDEVLMAFSPLRGIQP
jgi:ribosomal protein S18 acetylase RimI-like enzyme